ncbi:hypothetical protein SFRURICE_006223 [Spodoptera frugiperda]|nr:hypothetical protein SFRURICE_006223 [Spodoptera frugiperda]
MKREHFAPNFEAALRNIATDTIRNEFRKSGLFPFGPEYVDMNKISSHNRAPVSTSALEKKIDTTKQFMNILESEIRSLFTNEKLKLFTRLYYMPRANVEDQLPNEDLSLYTIWAKTKDYLNENLPQKVAATITEQVSHSSEPEHVTESESLPPQTPEAFVADNSISTLPEHVLDVSDHISDKPLITKNLQGSSQNIIEENIEPVTESTKTISKDIACSAIYSTPNKVQNSELNNTISKPMPSKPQNVMDENIPSPFKRALFWPEPEMKKRRSKERLPSAITGETWRAYMIKKENEKKQKEEEKNKRMKERQDKNK